MNKTPELKRPQPAAMGAAALIALLLLFRAVSPSQGQDFSQSQEPVPPSELKETCCFKTDRSNPDLMFLSEQCSAAAGDSCFIAVHEDGIQFIPDGIQFIPVTYCEAETYLPCFACGLPRVRCF